MLPNQRTSLVPVVDQWRRNFGPKPVPQIKYSLEDYDLSNKNNWDLSCSQERLAERVISENRLALEDADEITASWQREVDMQIRERLSEVEFLYDESVKQRKVAALENEALTTYSNRIKNALENIKKSKSISQQCFVLRQSRTGIDLCTDEVEKQLIQEQKALTGAQALLERSSQEMKEQLRSLNETIYLLDEDIENKSGAIHIDKNNMTLRESLSTLGEGNDLSQNFCKYTLAEWQKISADNIQRVSKEINNASSFRAYIDMILQQVSGDLNNQTERTNLAFKRRIDETRKIKHVLEERHSKCGSNIVDLSSTITDLEQKLKDKQRALLLCQTRLSNRARRLDTEKACDLGQEALNLEHSTIQASLCKLKQKLDESKGALRYLLHTNIMAEEQINIKANSLKIDEVDCMTLREILKFVPF